MSWNVREQDWLTEPTASPSSGPMDALDDQVLSAMGTTQQQAPVSAPSMETLPPPPPSAAFESHERPAYESAPLVEDPPAAESTANAVVPPEPTQALEQAGGAATESPEFHIPTLFGVQTQEAQLAEPAPPVAAPSEAPAGLVIPTLSRLKWVPAPETDSKSPDAPVNVAASVYDDEEPSDAPTTPEPGHPEVLEQVDSAELELVGTDDVEESRQEDETHDVAFVIPTLARPDAAEPRDHSEHLDISLQPPAGRNDLVIPMLMRTEPVAAPEPPITHVPAPDISPAPPEAHPEEPSLDAPEPDAPYPSHLPDIASADDVEEFEEVEAEAIESLDVADLVETETDAETESTPELETSEAKPRSQPPDAKPQPQKRRKAWYDDVFAEHFSFLAPATWDETAQRDAQFIHDQLGLREGASVLDVGCGDGHHAIELAKLGLRVTGVDNSLAMLLAAAQLKEAAGIDDERVTFMHGDMRRLPRDREFEAVMCVGTTFGYFEEEQNRQCLQEMVDRLAVGGRLLLHVFNRDFVAPHLPSRSWWQGRRCMVIDEAEMNFFANRLRVHRTIIFDDGRQYEHFMFMRAYTVQDLGKAMSQLGLRVAEVSGSRDTRARFYGSASPDIWIVAERK
jgi:SAM-dependent methyltransferase